MLAVRVFAVLSLVLVSAIGIAGCGSDDEREPGVVAPKGSDGGAEEAAEPPVVIPGTGIGRVAIGDEREALLKAFGDPAQTLELENEFSGGTNDRLEWTKPHAIAAVVAPIPPDDPKADPGSEVIQIETTDDQVRTGNGVGVGDSRQDVEAAYPEVECDPGGGSGVVLCRLGEETAGSVTTDFFVEDDAVTRIVVGRIID